MKNEATTTELQGEIAVLKGEVAQLKALVKYYEERFRLSQHRQLVWDVEREEPVRLRTAVDLRRSGVVCQQERAGTGA